MDFCRERKRNERNVMKRENEKRKNNNEKLQISMRKWPIHFKQCEIMCAVRCGQSMLIQYSHG